MVRRHKAFSPANIAGLSLWLKADAGTTTVAEQFISQIIFSGAGTTTSNGTYTRASGGNTSFTGPNENTLNLNEVDEGTMYFQIFDTDFNDTTYTVGILYDQITFIGTSNGEGPNPTATTSLTATGNTIVTAWADQSGNGKNMTALAGSEPTFIASELNGKPVIDFATSKYLTASFAPINFTQQTVFVVFKFVSENLSSFARPFSQSNIDYGDYDTPGNLLPILRNDGTDYMWCFSATDSFLVGSPTSDNAWYISTTKTDGTNGSFLINATNEQAFETTFDASITNMRVGGALFPAGELNDPFNSKLAEVIVYDRNLTTPERQQIEAYLNTKYDIF